MFDGVVGANCGDALHLNEGTHRKCQHANTRTSWQLFRKELTGFSIIAHHAEALMHTLTYASFIVPKSFFISAR